MRIPQEHINSTVYIYASEEDARNGVSAGGSGFFVGIDSGEDNLYFGYGVTNAHVIVSCSENPAIKVNKNGGSFEVLVTSKSDWQFHPDGDDIAVYQLRGLAKLDLDIGLIMTTTFVTEANIQKNDLNIGPGDNTYMIGRFIYHEGDINNTPIIRYGNISLNPAKDRKVSNPETHHEDEVFLIESRSVSGYSGSAVFTYIPGFDYRDKKIEISGDTNVLPTPYFLGVNIGHTQIMRSIKVKKPQKPTDYVDYKVNSTLLYSEYNSGIMRIAPAWKLQEVLDMKFFENVRKEAKKQFNDGRKGAPHR